MLQYLDEMFEKFGFSDGDATPPDAYESREVYLRFLNPLLEKKGSKVRLVGYDRPGLHNHCIVVKSDVEFFEEERKKSKDNSYFITVDRFPEDFYEKHEIHDGDEDEAWREVLDIAGDFSLDLVIETEVKVDYKALERMLKDAMDEIKEEK